jgi:ABC-type sugar transport system permease subunit
MAKRDLGDVAATALTRPGVGLALLAALGVYLVIAFRGLLSTIAYVVTDLNYAQDSANYLSLILPASLPLAFGPPLPFAIGVFLSFWQIAPVAPQLRMAHVVTRALLAAVVGAVASLVLGFIVAVVLNVAGTSGQILAASDLASIGRNLLDAAHAVLPGALNILIDGLVIVPLAALLLWGRLQSHPPKTAPAGALDEV